MISEKFTAFWNLRREMAFLIIHYTDVQKNKLRASRSLWEFNSIYMMSFSTNLPWGLFDYTSMWKIASFSLPLVFFLPARDIFLMPGLVTSDSFQFRGTALVMKDRHTQNDVHIWTRCWWHRQVLEFGSILYNIIVNELSGFMERMYIC